MYVGDGGDQDGGGLDGGDQGGAVQGLVAEVELGVEQLTHPGLHRIGEPAGDDDFGFSGGHGRFANSKKGVRRGGDWRVVR